MRGGRAGHSYQTALSTAELPVQAKHRHGGVQDRGWHCRPETRQQLSLSTTATAATTTTAAAATTTAAATTG